MIKNDNFTGIRMLVKATVNSYGYQVIEMNKEGRLYNNTVKSNETSIRVNKDIIGEIRVAGIRIATIKNEDERTIQEIWTTQFDK